jgi:hypothetical protein
MEQSCQGALNNKQLIQEICKSRLITKGDGLLEMQAQYFFLNRQLKGYCHEWPKYVGAPQT